MIEEGFVLKEENGTTGVSLTKYYINFCGKWIGTVLASDKDKATVKARMYFKYKKVVIEGGEIEVDETTIEYLVACTELEYQELNLSIEDILEDWTLNKKE